MHVGRGHSGCRGGRTLRRGGRFGRAPLSCATVIDVALLRLDDSLEPPRRIRSGDAAADLPSADSLVLEAGQRTLVPTGFAVAIPEGYAGLILPRSGLALHHGVTVLNAPGLIDAGYRGELKVVLHNTSAEPVPIERGQRIAQLLIVAVPGVRFGLVEELPAASDDRGANGFGSSG